MFTDPYSKLLKKLVEAKFYDNLEEAEGMITEMRMVKKITAEEANELYVIAKNIYK